MATGENGHFFPLTSLQIGDMQSYLSRLTLFLPPESKRFYILVDNRPWLVSQDARSAHLWQLMVTKSRLSPFAITRTKSRRDKKDIGKKLNYMNSSRSKPVRLKSFSRWFSLVDAAVSQKKALLPVKKLKDSFLLNKELHRILFGFIVFEVAWTDVRGINYLNELQTDTSMALEAKSMKRWEFDSVEQASSLMFLWFSGTYNECIILQEYLDGISNRGDVFYDAQEDFSLGMPSGACEGGSDDDASHDDRSYDGSSNSADFPGEHTPPVSGPYKRRKIMKASGEVNKVSEEACTETVSSPTLSVSSSSSDNHDYENVNTRFSEAATNYKDVLICFRFNDPYLPFKFKKIIMSDLKLLTLLEYGLPSWVIFLQSYPIFCQIYRPWMCPLARALYVLMSVITVLIGFYDLYKNVPLIKATASHLFGPFFDWIETWEMVSRIKYLGTMLFLHNFEIAVKWLLMITHATKSFFSFLMMPIAGPVMEIVEFILPLWNICLETIEGICSVIYIVLGSSYNIIAGVLQIVVWPLWFALSVVWTIAAWVVYPIFSVFWEIIIAPVRLCLAMAGFITMFLSDAYYFLKESWSSISTLFQFASASKASVGSYETSMWRSLWNDLFSQVFRAVRSILYGFVAFFTTCNRHRLSIYNHIQKLLLRLSCVARSSDSRHGLQGQRENPLEESRRSMDRHSLQLEHLHRRRSRKFEEVAIDR
ncbi:uncharacterized protein A4U43_C03F30700 [Asparagus officinalis]|uniref:Uncharacterized protein n=1 Tax=Asparagus officinalis TaxID=4686 RepID=A0A5P1FJ41_ASPOF|nr:uncharacterized protein LOC109835694 isoform X2 [Asparagus officinalis]ONK76661.1 uncharacterized protein A4U43_C03F30700 [Asparagus officinalis]